MRNKYLGIFIACAILLLLAACLQPSTKNNTADQATQLVQQGDSLSQQGNYDEAINEYTAAITLDPTLISAYIRRGQAYFLNGRSLMALTDYSNAVGLDPNSAPAYYGRGWSQLGNSAWAGAVSDFDQTIKLDPNQVRAYNGRGWGHVNLAKWVFEDGYGGLFYLFESHHGLTMAFKGRGWYYVKQAQWETAVIPDLAQAMTQDPDPAEAYCNLGFAHAKEAQWAHAISDYKAAITKDPSLDWSWYNTEWATGRKDRWNSVIADYSRVIEMTTGQSPAEVKLGATENEEWDMAIASYNKAIEISKNPELTQKAKDALKLIDEIRQDINR